MLANIVVDDTIDFIDSFGCDSPKELQQIIVNIISAYTLPNSLVFVGQVYTYKILDLHAFVYNYVGELLGYYPIDKKVCFIIG